MTSTSVVRSFSALNEPDAQGFLFHVGYLHGSTFGIQSPDCLLCNFKSYMQGWEAGCSDVPSRDRGATDNVIRKIPLPGCENLSQGGPLDLD